ncbi:MAG: hypothetical protein ABII85_04265 [Bacillota bacterium]
MKKIILIALFIIFVGFGFPVEASNYVDEEQLTYNSTTFTKTYYENGKVVHEKQMLEKDYKKEVTKEKAKAEEILKIKSKVTQNVPITDEEEALLSPSLNVLYLIPSFGPYHDPIGEDECYDNAEGCTIYAVYDEVSYSILQTTVVLFPNNTVEEDGRTGYISAMLTWDVLPYNRKDDLISVSWDGDDFSANYSSINTHVRNEYIYGEAVNAGTYFVYWNEYNDVMIDDFDIVNYGDRYNLSDDGVVFQVPLLDNKTTEILWEGVNDPYDIDPSYEDYLLVTKIVITLYVDVKLDHIQSIDADFLTNAQFGADYVHFYDMLSFKIGLSSSISITGPSASISISPTITETYDKHRYTYIDFTFTSYIPSC